MKQKHIIGSISSGTMRKEDLIPVFFNTLKYFSKSKAKKLLKEFELSEDSDFFLEKLFDLLNE